MARPKTKAELIQTGTEEYEKLLALINSIPEKDVDGVFRFDIEKEKGAHWKRDKNIRDVLVHLYEWHKLLIDWVSANQKGVEMQFLKEGYNWKTYGAMNQVFWENHQETSYEDSLKLLTDSHSQVMNQIETFSEDELFSKGAFKWVGGSTLGSYFVSATSSHYNWASKKIKKYKKSLAV